MSLSAAPRIVTLPPERTGEAVAVLCDAFRDYPVMRYVLFGSDAWRPAWQSPPEHEEGVELLVTFFVLARVLRGEPVLGVEVAEEGGTALAGVATLTLPRSGAAPASLDPHRDRTWGQLGEGARARYEHLGLIWSTFRTAEPHHHLNMVGVRRRFAGRGLGRALLDEVHLRSAADPDSAGVSLTTEDPRNVEIYRHVGYHVTGEGHIPGALRTWGMFRPG